MAFNKVLKCNITLEDIFTIFDIFSANKQYISYFSDKEINEFNKKFQMCIVYAISYNITFLSKMDEYLAFSSLLLEQIDSNDNVAVITTNWDNLFEKSLSFLCEKHNSKAPKQKHIYPSYSFDNYPFYYKIENKSKTIIKNNLIKVLKLHGSISWLECPRCGRVYIDYKKDIATNTFSETTCAKCSEELKKDDRPILRNIIITPTYLKSLNSLCIKNTWQNAFFALNEASKIVFIGYSFPEADFEMRSLLKKSIRKDANINVILCKSDNPKYYDKMIKIKNKMNKKKIIEKINLPEQRYKSFFGGNNLEFYYGGFLRYIEKARSK